MNAIFFHFYLQVKQLLRAKLEVFLTQNIPHVFDIMLKGFFIVKGEDGLWVTGNGLWEILKTRDCHAQYKCTITITKGRGDPAPTIEK